MNTILIVDDSAGFRVQARALLAADGFEVVGEAADGLSGLEAARTLRPDLVLLDIGLPDVEGFEVARELAVDGPPPFVVLTSSREAGAYGPRLAASRVLGFIPKDELSGAAIRASSRCHDAADRRSRTTPSSCARASPGCSPRPGSRSSPRPATRPAARRGP